VVREGALKPHGDGLLLDQGDVLSDAPLVSWKTGEAVQGENRAVITSHGCVCEEYERLMNSGKSNAASRILIQVAPLRPAKVFRDKIKLIREGKLLDYFFVEGDGQKLQHQVAILSGEQPVPARLLVDCKKVARLSDWQWERLRLQLTVARFRVKPDEIFREELLKGAER
jgi:hypothetical protein